MRWGLVVAALLALVVPASADAAQTRYSLVNGCWAVQGADGTRSAPLRLHAAGLGAYLLYTADGQYLTTTGAAIAPAAKPTVASIYRVDSGSAGTFRLRTDGGRTLGLDGSPEPASDVGVASGALAPAAEGARVSFVAAEGCGDVPEASVDATGTPMKGASPVGRTQGLMDSHAHLMAFDFLGGDLHCGKPWSPMGVTVALPDCESIQGPQGAGAPVQNFLDYGQPVAPHDTVGWPSFVDWPTHEKLSYEQTYFKWLERAWRGGTRLIVNDFVENEALCTLMPRKKTDCNDMSAVRRQKQELYAFQDYIDAQSGGPGKGWFRIVLSPWEARKVINQGKIAVVMGIELSRIMGCGVPNGVAECTTPEMLTRLDDLKAAGIRSFFPVHKFDNAFGGTKMDSEALGPLVNLGNFLKNGSFWAVERCGEGVDPDNTQITNVPIDLAAALGITLPPSSLPAYGAPPHCNSRGLTDLGAELIKAMAARGFIVEIDHMDQKTGAAALGILEQLQYSGVVSSHDWQHPSDNKRILGLGGVISPFPKQAVGYVKQWQTLKSLASSKFRFGIGYGADMNGLGSQAPPRKPADGSDAPGVSYPFKAMDQGVTMDRVKAGTQTWDVNEDGVAHYGLIPDFMEDARLIAGDEIRRDLLNGPEAYLEMWERAVGAPGPRCQAPGSTLVSRARGVGAVRLGASAESVLRAAGQPASRPGRSLRWCGGVRAVFRGSAVELAARGLSSATPAPRVRVPRVAGTKRPKARVADPASVAVTASAAPIASAAAKPPRVRVVRGFGGRVLVRRAAAGRGIVYVLPRRGARSTRVVAVASKTALRSRTSLRSALRAAGIRV